jgi:hypothetical protein
MGREDETFGEVDSWEEGVCSDCDLPFPQRNHYEKRCVVCYKIDKDYKVLWGDLAFLWAQERLGETRRSLQEAEESRIFLEAICVTPKKARLDPTLVRDLIKLAHPDRHQNSPLSTRVTQQLLAMRKRKKKS